MNHSAPSDSSREGGLLAWFARNHVAANLLMFAIVATGIIVGLNIRQEVFPTFALDTVRVSMEYRGASPEEVERSIILPIESELRSLELVRRLHSEATEGEAESRSRSCPGMIAIERSRK